MVSGKRYKKTSRNEGIDEMHRPQQIGNNIIIWYLLYPLLYLDYSFPV